MSKLKEGASRLNLHTLQIPNDQIKNCSLNHYIIFYEGESNENPKKIFKI
jgi:hypothetical protein